MAEKYHLTQMLVVVEEDAGQVHFYHPDTGENLGGLHVGFLPHEVVTSKDGKTAFVSNFGIRDYDSGLGIPGTSVSVIDIPTRTERYRLFTFDPAENKQDVDINSAPHGVSLRPPAENLLYVNVEKGHHVLVYELASKKIIKKFPVSPYTHNIFFSPDGKTLWLMAGRDGVIRMDPDTGEVTGSLPLPTPLRGLRYSHDYQYLIASGINQVTFIDPTQLKVKKQFDQLGLGQIFYSDMTSDHRYLVLPATMDSNVVIVETETGKIKKRLVPGLNPLTVKINVDDKFAYVTNVTDYHVTKINLQTYQMTSIRTQAAPNGIAFTPYISAKKHKNLILGVALPLTGIHAPVGHAIMRGYEYWRVLVDRAGGLFVNDDAYDISIVYADTQSQPQAIQSLTQALISEQGVSILLSTYDQQADVIAREVALKNHCLMTPPFGPEKTWQPNDMAKGHDYFVTTNTYNRMFYAQYTFKASHFSAAATALGIAFQQAALATGSLEQKKLAMYFAENQFNLFYQY